MVRLMQHAVPPAVPERQAPGHGPVCQGSGAEEAYGEPIHNVSEFRYLGRVLTTGDYAWLEVVGNLGKVRKSWGRLSRILIREGADTKVSGNFYKAVAQAVLLFGA